RWPCLTSTARWSALPCAGGSDEIRSRNAGECVSVGLRCSLAVRAQRQTGERCGVTDPELRDWRASSRGYRRSEITAPIGHGEGVWTRAAEGVLRWGVKTASGFTV